MKSTVRASLIAALLLTGCRASEQVGNQAHPKVVEASVAPILTTPDAVDVHSFAHPFEARVTHVVLDLTINFETRRIDGTAALDIDRKPDAKQIVLDDNGLEIAGITDAAKRPLPYRVGAKDSNLGSPLAISLAPDTRRIVITYKSAPQAGALLWLTPEQTAGKKAPFVFSQGESIENRTWIPTQDSPGIRQTWEAAIHVPAGMTAVMSAPRIEQPITQGGESVFNFRMDHSVAPYMIAIAVGDLAFRPLGPRTGVWAEPTTLPAAARELSDTENGCGGREALRPLSVGPLRRARPAAVLPLRRRGKPQHDLSHADLHRRRQKPRQPRRARTFAQLVRQPRDQRDVERFLAQRRHDDLCRATRR